MAWRSVKTTIQVLEKVERLLVRLIRKKAIASLAYILENVRADAKELFNSEFDIPKNEHDRLIFDIVNNYNIRHDNQRQKTDYSKEIWYDWMM